MESRWPLMGSTLQSLLRGEPTEIDYLNGEIVRVGGKVGMAAPINTAIVRAVHEIERTRPVPDAREARWRSKPATAAGDVSRLSEA